jgi:hypothetical protein
MEIWYYANAGEERQGPVSAGQIKLLFQRQQIDHQTQLWCEGMYDWMPLGALARQFDLDGAAMDGAQVPTNPYARPAASGQVGTGPKLPPVPNHLLWAILTTLFCCLPMGIVSIVYAVKVDRHRADGDLQAARAASRAAGQWAFWSAAVCVILLFLIALGEFLATALR